MLSPGFIIQNDTAWPLQISLNQVGPLYFGVVQPGQTFVRRTGAVWFTIKAGVFLDEKDRITSWDAVWPIASVVGGVLVTAVTAGAAAYAAGPAMAAAGGATALGAGATSGMGAAALAVTSAMAQSLVGAGLSAGASLVVSGVVISGGAAALTGATSAALSDVFSKANTAVSLAGCYAGPPWPFRRELSTWHVRGGPTFSPLADKNQIELKGAPLVLTR